MKPKSTRQPIWLPIAVSLAVVAGLVIGNHISPNQYAADNDRKVNAILNLINQDYVDSTNINDLIEMSIPEILKNLDPHTTYMSAEDLRAMNENMKGSTSDIGIQFEMQKDTAWVIEAIPGSPSSKVGIMPGDRIVSINSTPVTGDKVTKSFIAKQLRGPKGSKVKLDIKRRSAAKTLTFTVTRGDIPVNTIDANYMIDKNTGYLKITHFGRNTFDEFIKSMKSLEGDGASRYIIDLRGNGGGFMEIAVRMANEFLPASKPIVSIKGRYKRDSNEAWSEGNGRFQDAEVVVLIDEYSASASEIFAGAMQDNDRGLIVGCRSYGKGLVQKDFILPDSSAIRLTIARYYTPSGRCIQKDYRRGDTDGYDNELMERYLRGELANPDSIKIDKSKIYTTAHGRTVYGGGGIVPDIFVPLDNDGLNGYYYEVEGAGLLHQFAFNYCHDNRPALSKMTDYKQFLRMAPGDDVLIKDFADFANANGIVPRWYYINESHDMIVTKIKALIARDIFGSQAYYPILNRNDKTVQAALKALNKHKAVFPITESLDLKSIALQRSKK